MSDAGDRASGRGQPEGTDHLRDELLSRLVDGGLSPAERRFADAHLTACAGCDARLDALRSTVALLQGLPSPRPARSFQLAPSHARPASGWGRFTAWLPVGMPALRAAVVAVVVVVGGAAAFAAIRDGDDLSGGSTGNVESEPTVAAAAGDTAPTLVPTAQDAMMVQTPAETPPPTATTDAAASRSGQDVDAAEIATSTPTPTQQVADEAPPVSAAPGTAPTATARMIPTATPARDGIFGLEADESSVASDDAVAVPTSTAADGAVDPPDEVSGDVAGDAAETESAAEAPQDAEVEEAPQDADEAAPESSAALVPATSTATASPSPTRRPPQRASTPLASPVASPIVSPVASPVASPSGQSIPIDGVATGGLSDRRIDAMLPLAILLMAGGIVVAVRAGRGAPR